MDLRFYLALLLRRLPVMLTFILVGTGLAVITAMKLPETYSTSARLLVEAPQIPERMVASTVQVGAAEQLEILQQRLMTRANLIDIANRFRVFENLRQMDPDTVVTRMREATLLRRTTGRNVEAMLLNITFTARSPKIAADVVNQYVTLILDESTSTRVGQAERTLQFFEQEAQRLSGELDRQSAAIVAFRGENADALPEDQSYRLSRQALLQERISRLERDIAAAETQRREILRIYESTGLVRPDSAAPQARLSAEQQQLATARSELERALSVYSESHPEIGRLRLLIQRLEAVVATQTAAAVPVEAAEDAQISTQQALLNATLAEIDTRSALAKEELATAEAELGRVQQAIAQSSSNGIQLASLQRDYENLQARYTGVVNNLNQARMSERIETTAQGQRISVIENANVPTQPAGPNRTKIIAMGLGAGSALAAAWFVLLEILNRSVRRPGELVARFSVTPLAIIPYMESRGEKLRRRAGLVAATVTVMVAVPLGLWYVDTHYLPLDVLVQKGLTRLGLG